MPRQRRHGLTTLLLTGGPDVPGALIGHLLAGRKTVVVRPVTDLGREPIDKAGDRVLLVDAAGGSIAVADVVSATVTTLDAVDEDTRRADDPDHVSAAQWGRAQVARWRAAGLLSTADGTGITPPPDPADVTVVVVHVRVVGLEATPSTTSCEGNLG
jgi:uncharacterized protein YhfF